MKYLIWFFFLASIGSIATGYFLEESYSEKLIGFGVVMLFFIVFPLFSYYRWKDKKVEDKENFSEDFLGLNGENEVYHLHNSYVDFSGLDFEVFTDGKVSQAVKHKKKNIYGVLFHPEVRGKDLIRNFCLL